MVELAPADLVDDGEVVEEEASEASLWLPVGATTRPVFLELLADVRAASGTGDGAAVVEDVSGSASGLKPDYSRFGCDQPQSPHFYWPVD